MELADDARATVNEASPVASAAPTTPTTAGPSPAVAIQPPEPLVNSNSQIVNPSAYVPLTLGEQLRWRGRLATDRCVELGLKLSSALGHLHKHGLIHRDIKPSNIIFVHGVANLADIGLVAAVDEARSFVGTEGFIPPEGPGTVQADIYSLGKVLYEAMTGKDRQEFPGLPTHLGDGTSDRELVELNEVVLKACETDPRRRYSTADELRADLVLLQGGRSVRHLRTIERRLSLLTRLGLAGGLAVALTVAGYNWSVRQTERRLLERAEFQEHEIKTVRRLASENQRIADTSRERLVRLNLANGIHHVEEGDLFGALPWFASAWEDDQRDPQRDLLHQVRFGTLLRHCPRLLHLWAPTGNVFYAEFSPDGRRVLLCGTGYGAQLWDTATGQGLDVVFPHGEKVLSAAFSPDGRPPGSHCRGRWHGAPLGRRHSPTPGTATQAREVRRTGPV
ncbi:MAG: protein kinase [Verrucomicrobiota bacterium]